MTAEEFGIYLGGCSIPIKEISEKTIKRYIKKLCKESNGKLNEKQFMSVVDDVEMYYIQPEYQQLLVVLFDTDYFGAKGRSKNGIDEKQRLRAQLAENVESFLEGETLFQVKLTPQFLNARLEDILASKINNEIRGMLATIRIADDTIQYQLMLETLDRLVAIRRWMNEWNTRIQLIKQEFANSEAEKQDAIDGTGKFKHKELKDIIVDVISARLDGKEYEHRLGCSGIDGVAIGLTYGKTMAEACEIGTRLAASVICTSENVCPRFLPSEFGIDPSGLEREQLSLEL